MKMKLFWVLVSCVFVCVSTDDLTEYKRFVSILNIHIRYASTRNIRRNNEASNGLVYVIERMLEHNMFSLEMLNSMYAVPEYQYLSNWSVLQAMQEKLRDKIREYLNVHYPEEPEPNYEGLRLKDLGEQRRQVTMVALKHLWNKAIVGDEYSVYWTCRMIALFMSIKFHDFISRDVGSYGSTCTIYNGITYTSYRRFGGRWWRVIGDDVRNYVPLVPEPL